MTNQTDQTEKQPVEEYDDELRAAVEAAQLQVTGEPVPEGLSIRLAAAKEARDAGVREWHVAGNRAAREVETPFLRIPPIEADEPDEAPKTSGRRSAKKSSGHRRSTTK